MCQNPVKYAGYVIGGPELFLDDEIDFWRFRQNAVKVIHIKI